MAVPTFVDRVTLHVSAGRGGHGVASVHREKFKPLGGPDGGNGGPGGSVILRVDPDVTTLIDYHHSPHRRAEHGGHGAGAHKNGGHGADLVLPVPDGTLVTTSDGTVRTYRVTTVTTVLKNRLPQRLFTRTGDRRLYLVTCGGPFNPAIGHYRDNVILTAVPR